MPLLKRAKKNDHDGGAPASAEAPAAGPADGEPVQAGPPEASHEAAASPPSPPPPPSPPAPRARGGAAGGPAGGLVGRFYGPPGEQSAEERQRIAEAEFQAAIAPALDLLVASVPDASGPQEAARRLEERLGDYTPDPGPGAYVHGDAFDGDARVYYRLLRRDYEKNPRPSESRRKSHHLHERYGLLPGHKGW